MGVTTPALSKAGIRAIPCAREATPYSVSRNQSRTLNLQPNSSGALRLGARATVSNIGLSAMIIEAARRTSVDGVHRARATQSGNPGLVARCPPGQLYGSEITSHVARAIMSAIGPIGGP